MLSPDRSSSTRSATSRLLSRRTLLLGGAVSLMAGCASDIRPLSEEAKAKVGSPAPSASASPSASSSASATATSSASASASASANATSSSSSAARVPVSEDALVEGWQKYPGPLKLTGEYMGEYQPATDSSPAKNVPKPLKTVPHREDPTFQGAYETLRAYYSAQITTLKDGRYADQAIELTYPADKSAIDEVKAVKELYEQNGWYMDFTCTISMRNTEPRTALKNGDGYVEIMMDAKYSATAIHQPDGSERKIPAITQVAIPHVMLYTEGKWWRIGNDYLNERLNGGKGSSDSSDSSSSGGSGSAGSSGSSGRGSTKV
ncbi:hypothetical protein HMPREF2845_04470 [Rothia sp. HMSC065B04]|uniref:DUF6318 family protein n=1 Tax=Rothia TaxID=32207 RepID=UPI0008A44445|nr:DUF6318 family protein [Rothia sp. HMSC065B04]OFJ76045.1 hypothetical protein HMPREF2845_04470 [Rothia sp. HMSC065B04]